jgi:DNA-3-methyladenine glycosylase
VRRLARRGLGHDRAGRGRLPLAAGRLTLDLAGDPVAAARELIGWTLLIEGVGGPIVETEAYAEDDPASHAFRGLRVRNAAMFGPPGTLYVYRSYGIHWCVNIVCRPVGAGAAVLVRSLEPEHGVEQMRARRGREPLATGPGNLGQALAAGPEMNGEPAVLLPPERGRAVASSLRIGITKGADRPWRFYDPESGFVSRPISSARRGRPRRTHA